MTDNNENVRGRVVAWLIECGGCWSVHLHNAVGDYRDIDPNATSAPLVLQSDLAAAIARAEADEDCWREGWAFAYSGSRLYGDDGELQDNSAQPFIDWRRDSAQEIRAKIQERGNRAIAAQQAEGEDRG